MNFSFVLFFLHTAKSLVETRFLTESVPGQSNGETILSAQQSQFQPPGQWNIKIPTKSHFYKYLNIIEFKPISYQHQVAFTNSTVIYSNCGNIIIAIGSVLISKDLCRASFDSWASWTCSFSGKKIKFTTQQSKADRFTNPEKQSAASKSGSVSSSAALTRNTRSASTHTTPLTTGCFCYNCYYIALLKMKHILYSW